MRRNLIIAALYLCAAPVAAQEADRMAKADAKAAQSQAAGGKVGVSAGAEHGAAQLVSQHEQALLRKDTATLERIWADDLTFINPGGEMLTKAQRLENVRSGATKFDSIESTDQKVRVYGDTAVVTGHYTIKGQYNTAKGQYSGQEVGGQYRVTLVGVRRGGQWQVVAIQMTPVATTTPVEKKP